MLYTSDKSTTALVETRIDQLLGPPCLVSVSSGDSLVKALEHLRARSEELRTRFVRLSSAANYYFLIKMDSSSKHHPMPMCFSLFPCKNNAGFNIQVEA